MQDGNRQNQALEAALRNIDRLGDIKSNSTADTPTEAIMRHRITLEGYAMVDQYGDWVLTSLGRRKAYAVPEQERHGAKILSLTERRAAGRPQER